MADSAIDLGPEDLAMSRADYRRIGVITSGRKAGLSLGEIRELLELYDPADGGAAQLRKAIERLRQRVRDLETELDLAAQHLSELEQRLVHQTKPEQGVGRGRPPRRIASDEVMGPEAR